ARIRHPRYLLAAMRATSAVRRELEADPACLRFATAFAGPRELLTLSVWTSHQAILDSSGTGMHGPLVWSRPRWLESYWAMRWRPGSWEGGKWGGTSMRALEGVPGGSGTGSAMLDPWPPASDAQAGARPPGFGSSPFAASPHGEFDGSLGVTYRLE